MVIIVRVFLKIFLVNICFYFFFLKNIMVGLIIFNKSFGYDGCISFVKKLVFF